MDFTIFTIVPVVLLKSQLMSVRELDARLQSDTFSYCACAYQPKYPAWQPNPRATPTVRLGLCLGRRALAC